MTGNVVWAGGRHPRHGRTLSQCPCCGRGECGHGARGLNALVAGGGIRLSQCPCAVSMPLLRAGGVRGAEARSAQAAGDPCLNALVAGGGECGLAGSQCPCCGRGGRVRLQGLNAALSQCPCCGRGECGTNLANLPGTVVLGTGVAVSMPLLRAGGVRAGGTTVTSTCGDRSQCPCCGRGVRRSFSSSAVSMPLLRAAGVRAKPLVTVFVGGTFVCLNALVAGGGSAGAGAVTVPDAVSMPLLRGRADWSDLSQCPCCGRGECGPCTTVTIGTYANSVSMPLLRAGGVRVYLHDQLPPELAGQPVSMPLLRAGGVRGASKPGIIKKLRLSSQCPCCGRGECGGSALHPRRSTDSPLAVSMPLLRAGGVRGVLGRPHVDSRGSTCLNALVAGGGSAGVTRRLCNHPHLCLNALVAGGGSAGLNCSVLPALQTPPVCLNALVAGGGSAGASKTQSMGRNGDESCLNALVAGGGSAGKSCDGLVPRCLADQGCLNALVAGGGSAGSRPRGCKHGREILSQCPCCGRGECGAQKHAPPKPQETPVSMPLLRAGGVRDPCCMPRDRVKRQPAVSMPLLRAGGVRAAPIVAAPFGLCLNALVAGGGSGPCLNALVAGGGSAGTDAAPARGRRCLNALVAGGGSAGSKVPFNTHSADE